MGTGVQWGGVVACGFLLVWCYPFPQPVAAPPPDPAPCGSLATATLADWLARAGGDSGAGAAAMDWLCPTVLNVAGSVQAERTDGIPE